MSVCTFGEVCTFAEVAWCTTMVLNPADECRQRADECRRSAAQVTDDVLRVTYLDLARRWRMMAHQAESPERKATSATKPASGTAEQVSASGSLAIFAAIRRPPTLPLQSPASR